MIKKKYRISKIQIKKNANGDIIKFLNSNSKIYKNFGEIYFSLIKYNKIKGWKLHKEMTMNLCVPFGEVKFILVLGNKFKEISLSRESYILTIFPNTWFAFKGLKKKESLVCNFANVLHDNKESISKPLNYFNYKW